MELNNNNYYDETNMKLETAIALWQNNLITLEELHKVLDMPHEHEIIPRIGYLNSNNEIIKPSRFLDGTMVWDDDYEHDKMWLDKWHFVYAKANEITPIERDIYKCCENHIRYYPLSPLFEQEAWDKLQMVADEEQRLMDYKEEHEIKVRWAAREILHDMIIIDAEN